MTADIDRLYARLQQQITELAAAIPLADTHPITDLVSDSACAEGRPAKIGRFVLEGRTHLAAADLLRAARNALVDHGFDPQEPNLGPDVNSVYEATGEIGVRVWPDGRVLVSGQTGCIETPD